GPLRTYAVEVESGVPVDVAAFAAEVDRVVADPRGWTADGAVAFQRVADLTTASFRIVLATPATTDELCAPLRTAGRFSCFQRGVVVLNLARWLEGTEAPGLELAAYREYILNHEVGHALGHPTVVCPAPGAVAPVMMRLTRDPSACLPNPWPFP
ncbi:MAG: DUF3152 domain-containing protein, partial [Acidimicrobiia bacterium]|nr:DUF3152 domain-containing protein [Acidimicrobiia bacterium]